ncbi:hypothetical protein PoB_005324700 [Plakobranchus ocellatus]|uniref:Uncharacterized protein n=1 Tax=Plakobranchus ocellatus TaxID=259542 RepID=A0AAV4C586_9GAST|nr:hypothetical protein PoB_005324700 [Plakobranchus ocellatus]
MFIHISLIWTILSTARPCSDLKWTLSGFKCLYSYQLCSITVECEPGKLDGEQVMDFNPQKTTWRRHELQGKNPCPQRKTSADYRACMQ